jgi:hypothetical protein
MLKRNEYDLRLRSMVVTAVDMQITRFWDVTSLQSGRKVPSFRSKLLPTCRNALEDRTLYNYKCLRTKCSEKY